jgi:hypothetical protein
MITEECTSITGQLYGGETKLLSGEGYARAQKMPAASGNPQSYAASLVFFQIAATCCFIFSTSSLLLRPSWYGICASSLETFLASFLWNKKWDKACGQLLVAASWLGGKVLGVSFHWHSAIRTSSSDLKRHKTIWI